MKWQEGAKKLEGGKEPSSIGKSGSLTLVKCSDTVVMSTISCRKKLKFLYFGQDFKYCALN